MASPRRSGGRSCRHSPVGRPRRLLAPGRRRPPGERARRRRLRSRRNSPPTSSASTPPPSSTTPPNSRCSRSASRSPRSRSTVARDRVPGRGRHRQPPRRRPWRRTCRDHDSDLQTLFSSGGEQAAVAGEYQSVASGNISGAIDALSVAQSHLATQQSQLQSAQSQAQTALAQAAAARQSAQATVAEPAGHPGPGEGPDRHPGRPAPGRRSWPPPTPPFSPGPPVPPPPAAPADHGRGQRPGPAGRPGPARPARRRWCRHRPRRGREPDRRALCVGRREPGPGFRLFGTDPVGLAPGRRRPAPHRGGAVRRHRPCPAVGPAARRPPLLGIRGYQPRGHVRRGRGRRQRPRHRELVRVEAIWNNGLVGAGRP